MCLSVVMRLLQIALMATSATAQFSSPSKSSSLEIGKQIDIKWDTKGLQAPISINLVPGGVAGQTIIAQQVAIGIQNIGLLTWTPDLTIAAFSSFSMVIIDSAARVVLSEEFVIQSLVQKPGFVTRLVPVVGNVVATDSKGSVATKMVTSMSRTLLPLPTEPIKVHMSGTQVVDSLVTGVNGPVPTPTQEVNKDGQNEGLLPLPGTEDVNQKPLGQLKPLPNISESTSTTLSAEPSDTREAKMGNGSGNGNSNGNGNGNGAMGKTGEKNQAAKVMKGKKKQGNGKSSHKGKQMSGQSAKGASRKSDKAKNQSKQQTSNSKKNMVKRSPPMAEIQLPSPENENTIPAPTQAQVQRRQQAPAATQANIRITLSPAIPGDDPQIVTIPFSRGNRQRLTTTRQNQPIGGGPLLTRPADATKTITTAIVPSGANNRNGAGSSPNGYAGGGKGDGDSETTEMGLAVKVGPGSILGAVVLVIGILVL